MENLNNIQGFDEWTASSNPTEEITEKEEGKELTFSEQMEELLAKDISALKKKERLETLDQVTKAIKEVRQRKRKAKRGTSERAEAIELRDNLKDMRDNLKLAIESKDKVSTEKSIKWKDVEGKFKLIRKADKDTERDTFKLKSLDSDAKIFKPGGGLSDDALAFISNTFKQIDDFKTVESAILKSDKDSPKQSMTFEIRKEFIDEDERARIEMEKEKKAEDEPKAEEETKARDTKVENALVVIVGAKKGRTKKMFEPFDDEFLIEWSNAITQKKPYWVSKVSGKKHRTLNAKVVKGNEPEILKYDKAALKPIATKDYAIDTYKGKKMNASDIEGIQNWIMNKSGNQEAASAIKNSGGADGKIGPGFDKAFKALVKAGDIKDVKDLSDRALLGKKKIDFSKYSQAVDTAKPLGGYPTWDKL